MATEGAPDAPPAAVPLPWLAPGSVIDGWRLQERLHTSAMAQLWGVLPVGGPDGPVLPRGCEGMALVMKVPRLRGSDDPAAIVGFEVEQMLLPALHGPHVPRFVARGDLVQQPYIVMERIPGDSLKPRLAQAPLPLDEVVGIGARVATALHDLHRQHLVHLDVKPSSVMQRPDGTVVLVDFGLSHHDHLPDLLDEAFPWPMGTGPYMSPEQVQVVRDDPRSDLFALGVMLYHFTTGQRPFGAPESVRGLRRRLVQPPVPPRALRSDCPPWLQEVILKCLEPQPDARWQSGAQLALALQNPNEVVLTERAMRLKRGPLPGRLRAWAEALLPRGARARQAQGVGRRVLRCPVVMAAVDTLHAEPALLAQLREAVRRTVAAEDGARLVCVGVMKAARIGSDERSDASGRNLHLQQLVGLRHWVRPLAQQLALDEGRLSCHVLEAADVAAALIDFARRNQVDHIVMGARGHSALRQYLGSVSAQVVAQAACTVTVVRA
ncbi:MAG: bifunctional serine/threonine-protein kinase/universal stress protein [Rubrivivax sp.]|nr:bifunctional serine/threonine-protein kinase/universal stress protein [Rubrivivax sp.]